MLSTIFPFQMFADITASDETTPVINEKNTNKIEEGKVLGEVQEKRTKNAITNIKIFSFHCSFYYLSLK